jgi:NAD/NADP transhydrogenase alpha subunit
MKIGIPKETQDHETRVAVTPSVVPLLLRDGHQVFIQSGAGLQAYCSDEMYRQAPQYYPMPRRSTSRRRSYSKYSRLASC